MIILQFDNRQFALLCITLLAGCMSLAADNEPTVNEAIALTGNIIDSYMEKVNESSDIH